MDEEVAAFIMFMFFVSIVICSIGFYGCGESNGTQKMKKEAVVVGLAYYTNDTAGESIWSWKTHSITNTINQIDVKLEKDEGVK
jgi:hypothetical protein